MGYVFSRGYVYCFSQMFQGLRLFKGLCLFRSLEYHNFLDFETSMFSTFFDKSSLAPVTHPFLRLWQFHLRLASGFFLGKQANRVLWQMIHCALTVLTALSQGHLLYFHCTIAQLVSCTTKIPTSYLHFNQSQHRFEFSTGDIYCDMWDKHKVWIFIIPLYV